MQRTICKAGKNPPCKTSWCKPSSYLLYVCKGELDRMNGQGLFLPSPLGWLHFLCALAARCALWRSFCSWLHFAEPHSAARTIHSAKNTHNKFLSRRRRQFFGDFFFHQVFSAILSVLKLSRWESFFKRELSCQHSSQQQHTREARM